MDGREQKVGSPVDRSPVLDQHKNRHEALLTSLTGRNGPARY